MQMQNSKKGFTLVELVIVIVVLAAMAVFAAVRYSDSDLALRDAAERMSSDLRFMRSLAMSANKPHGIRFLKVNEVSFSGYSLWYRDENGVETPYTDTSHVKPVDFGEEYKGVSAAVIMPEKFPNNGMVVEEIVFYFDGTPYLNFSLDPPLEDYARIEFNKGGKTRTVVVYPNSGEVKIE